MKKKNNNYNLRYSFNFGINISEKNIGINNKLFSMTLRPRQKL